MSQLKRQSNFKTWLLHAVKGSWNWWRSHILKVHRRLLISTANCVTQMRRHHCLVNRHWRVSEKPVLPHDANLCFLTVGCMHPNRSSSCNCLLCGQGLLRVVFSFCRFFFGNSTVIIREMRKHSIYFGTDSIYSGTRSIYFGTKSIYSGTDSIYFGIICIQ